MESSSPTETDSLTLEFRLSVNKWTAAIGSIAFDDAVWLTRQLCCLAYFPVFLAFVQTLQDFVLVV